MLVGFEYTSMNVKIIPSTELNFIFFNTAKVVNEMNTENLVVAMKIVHVWNVIFRFY